MGESASSSRSLLARAAASAGSVKALAGAAVAVIGLLAVVVPLLAGGGGGGREPSAEFVEGRLTQPMIKGDFERLRAVLAGEGPAAGDAADPSDDWPGAWISLRLVLRGVEGTRFTWAVLERGTNDVAFTSDDAGTSAAGPPPSEAGTPVQADVWVPFPARLGRYVVAVYLLPATGGRLDEYVSPPFRVASLPGRGAPLPAPAPTPSPTPIPSPSPAPPDPTFEDAPGAGESTPQPEPSPPSPDGLPAIDVPAPVFSTPGERPAPAPVRPAAPPAP
jgi:hypothetical protein